MEMNENEYPLAYLTDALKMIRSARDHRATHGRYAPDGNSGEGPQDAGQPFDDWAADLADRALTAFRATPMSEQTPERLTDDEQAELASIMGRLFLPDFTEREVAIVTATASAVLAKVRGQSSTLTARCEALEKENKQLRSAMRDAEQLYDEGNSRCEALEAEKRTLTERCDEQVRYIAIVESREKSEHRRRCEALGHADH